MNPAQPSSPAPVTSGGPSGTSTPTPAQAIVAAHAGLVADAARRLLPPDATPPDFLHYLEASGPSSGTRQPEAAMSPAGATARSATGASAGALDDLGIVELAAAIAEGSITASAATEHALDRLERLGPALNAVVALDRERALEQARSVDARRAAGHRLGPLAGVPMAHKDLFYRRGRVSGCGSPLRRDFVPDTTATVLSRLDEAGAIDLGRLHMAEFAMSPTGYNQHLGSARNPWNPAHVTGGSSSGSGAVVAARLVPGSLGTDSGGSIRYPAAMCGITGIKPTWSRVSRAGVMPLAWSLDCIGPLATSARDCARLLRVIAGTDPADRLTSPRAVPDYEAALDGDLRGLRIAHVQGYYEEVLHPDVARALGELHAVLRDRGATLVPTRPPGMDLVNAGFLVLLAVEAAALHRQGLVAHPERYGEQLRTRLEPGLFYPATTYAQLLALRAKVAADWVAGALGTCDAALLPAVPVPVPTIAETTEGDTAAIAARLAGVTHCIRGINYLGLPAVAAPCGFAQGLPVGFQLVGRAFDEALLLRIADACQRSTDFHRRRPPHS